MQIFFLSLRIRDFHEILYRYSGKLLEFYLFYLYFYNFTFFLVFKGKRVFFDHFFLIM